ncbi:MAG: excisionase family DNA-binding protein [Bacteroidales bacterium]
MNDETLLTQAEAAKLLRISNPTFIKLKRTGVFSYYRSGRKFLFSKAEVLEALKNIKF